MRKILIFIFVAVSVSAKSQSVNVIPKDTTASQGDNYRVSYSNKGSLSITGGVGYCTIFLRIYGIQESGQNGTPIPISATPAYNAFIDYGITKSSSLGLAVTYQAVTGDPQFPETVVDTFTCIERITRLNIGVRYIKYKLSDNGSGFYYGARVGVSFWTDILPSYLRGEEMLGAPFKVLPSIQGFLGYRLVIAKHLILHAEFGLGTPYLVEAGLGFKI